MLASSDEIIDELQLASQQGTRYPAIVDDPEFVQADRQMGKTYLFHWLSSNLQDPGLRVPPCVDSGVRQYARDAVRRGMDMNDLGSWRGAQHTMWDRWVDGCFAATSDLTELRALIKVSERSVSTFIDDSILELNAYVDQERTELVRGVNAQRQATVQLLLEGAPIGRTLAETQLGYSLAGSHLAAIIWLDSNDDDATRLDAAAEVVLRLCDAPRRLTLNASTATLWLWLPAGVAPQVQRCEAALAELPGVHVAFGRPARDLDGFRRSHLDAASAQRVLARVGSARRVVRYEDVALVAVLTTDMAQADQFVADTLGDLATADRVLRETVLTYVRERFNGSSTAERMFTHRNTIERRLTRADQLLPQPLADDAASVVAALSLVALRDSP
ncbi:PucR family transcriptional regulator [Gordonia sp. TBRC 11910]|uniref:PucR family transcriptional regulator n=2 Tax=Gordonia asplenii TaxID=2725283 RepID=A0A848L7F3_9ACTN|nr:PucR family transcriptional regulator [Gordonia asplenii]